MLEELKLKHKVLAPCAVTCRKKFTTNITHIVSSHIEEFNHSISHYRMEHAPNTRYLPSDINVTLMHASLIEKNPDCNISYKFYRRKLKEKHISFATLGNEECEG